MRVLVVGAGPTGLTLSLALTRRGVAHRLVEQAPAPTVQSRAIGIQARTLEVFEKLGLAERFLGAAHRLGGMTVHFGEGRTGRIELAGVHPRFPSLVSLPQSETEILLAAAGASPERGVTFVGVVAGAHGVTARLRHADGREEEDRADWLVGCDGAHSAVRHALDASFAGKRYSQSFLLADCALDGLDRRSGHLFPSGGAMRAMIPLPKDRWRAILVLPPGTDPPAAETLEPFQSAMPAGVRLHDLAWWSAFGISRRMVEKNRFGRVILAGDAAHIHSPAGGQGMNLGIQDAYSLAAALPCGEAAIDAWAATRHAVAHRVLVATDIATRVFVATGRLGERLRPAAFSLLVRFPGAMRRIERGLAGMGYPPVPD